jgi:site-specific recombinase XerD
MQKQTKCLVPSIIGAFENHLKTSCGLSCGTCFCYSRYVQNFLYALNDEGPVDLADLQPADLISYVTEQSSHYKPKTTKLLVTSLRSFIRFLQLEGICDAQLVNSVPTIHQWRLADLPASLSDDQLTLLLTSFNRSTANGLRGYAMVRCMADLGLRAHEVAHICLDDIDWRAGTLKIQTTKARRGSILPLPVNVGEAVAAYLHNGRPCTCERRVFVRHIRPVGKPLSSSAVRAVIRRAFKRTDIDAQTSGTHILRHTAATRMICQGASLKEIADILRHRHIDTTAIYAKVDLSTLRQVAMAWPEVQK